MRVGVTGPEHHGRMRTSTTDAGRAFRRTKEGVADKVRKLLTQAEDPAATAEEAQTFTMKAQQLMSKYSIDLAMVADAGQGEQPVEKGWVLNNPYATHKVTLVNAVARANDCRVIYADLGGGRKRVQVVGYPTDVEWVETLSLSLEVQLAGALAAGMRHKPPGVHGRTYSVGFVQGFIGEVSRRLQHARRQAVAASEAARQDEQRSAGRAALEAGLEVVAPVPDSVALVLVAKQERVEEEFRVRHPSTRTVHRQVRLQSWSGFAPGRNAGSRASLARGHVGGSRPSLSA
jgi:hypothetical protein